MLYKRCNILGFKLIHVDKGPPGDVNNVTINHVDGFSANLRSCHIWECQLSSRNSLPTMFATPYWFSLDWASDMFDASVLVLIGSGCNGYVTCISWPNEMMLLAIMKSIWAPCRIPPGAGQCTPWLCAVKWAPSNCTGQLGLVLMSCLIEIDLACLCVLTTFRTD